MHWNYRLLRRTEYGEDNLYVVEVFYGSEDQSVIGWSAKEIVWGESVDDLRQTLGWMLEATEKPILDEAELLQRSEEMEAMGADVHEVGIKFLDHSASE